MTRLADQPATRAIIRRALHDAIDWQESLADSLNGFVPIEYEKCIERVRRYRRILKRRYGEDH